MENDILKYALEHGMLDLSSIASQVEMTKREKILKCHQYSIWQGKNGKWYTYLPNKEGGRGPLKKRTSQEDIHALLVDFYTNKDREIHKQEIEAKKQQEIERYRFDRCYVFWKNKQIDYLRNPNTIAKYDSDYNRYFKGTDFELMDIRDITEEDVSIFTIQKIEELELKAKAGKALWSYIKRILQCAKINRRITENPCDYVDTNIFTKHYNTKEKPVAQKIVSDNKMRQIMEQVSKDYVNKPWFITPYAIELSTLTGMRAGELAGLQWSDILFDQGVMIISKSEKYDRLNKRFYISHTKNDKVRTYPLTDKLIAFFEKLRVLKAEQGISDSCSYYDKDGNIQVGDFVFTNPDGKIRVTAISDSIKIKCLQAGTTETSSIHAIRRTINSKMRCSGVSATVAASLLGHTEKVNEAFYTFDITEMDYKRGVLEEASLS